jgi:hypothetical protein
LSLDQLHDDVGLAVRSLTVVVERGDVRVRERGDGARLAQEARVIEVVRGGRGVRNFKRDAATETRVFGKIDCAHAALAKLRENAVVGNGLADQLARRLLVLDVYEPLKLVR